MTLSDLFLSVLPVTFQPVKHWHTFMNVIQVGLYTTKKNTAKLFKPEVGPTLDEVK